MLLNVTVRGVTMDPSLESLVQHKLHYALDRFGHWVQRVEVALEDLNGPKGGVDKRCRMTVSVPRRRDVVVEGRGEQLMSVVAEVIDRAALALDRVRGKKRAARHATVTPEAE
ncbi:MAG TPA: HPF/RaiA family ribosome-associated protein [Planctomycetaceae bacterium]|nr:HPF/RaiA family ribosome-associated protein [Planctomycetaceae bacterium]